MVIDILVTSFTECFDQYKFELILNMLCQEQRCSNFQRTRRYLSYKNMFRLSSLLNITLILLHFLLHILLTVAGIGLFRAVCYVSAPVAIVKSLISLLHGYVACRNLGIVDAKEREALRFKNQ